MSVTKIDQDEYNQSLQGGDGLVEQHEIYGGLSEGMTLTSGAVILSIFEHPESSCAWVVVRSKGQLYSIDIPYMGG
jgi:hypothetical protein